MIILLCQQTILFETSKCSAIALVQLIIEEKLKEAETRAFVECAFRDGGIKTTGTDIDKILPAVSRFGGGGENRKAKKETFIEKLKWFFERFWNIG